MAAFVNFGSISILILCLSIEIGFCVIGKNEDDQLAAFKFLFSGPNQKSSSFVNSSGLNEEPVFYFQPEQIHISYGENLSSMVVTWSTKHSTKHSIVEYGIKGLIKKAFGGETLFIDDGPEKRYQYIHRVTLSNLRPNELYFYHCGSELGWSPEFWFKTPRTDPDWSPHLAVYGDLGNINAQSLPRLQQETQRNMYDAILHVGDFAYDMNYENGEVGDEFMRQLTPIAAYVPYMVVPGNHEEKYNFSHYKNRFSMPGGTENLMYSFNMGPAHFIGFSTEVYYFLGYGIKSLVLQYEWLENDLKEATKPENRAKQPWIITFGHRPMYCSNSDKDDCTYHSTLVRVGLPILKCGYLRINQNCMPFSFDNQYHRRMKRKKWKKSIRNANYYPSLYPKINPSKSDKCSSPVCPCQNLPPVSWVPRITCTM